MMQLIVHMLVNYFFFFKQKTAYEMQRGLVGSEMCIRDRYQRRVHGPEDSLEEDDYDTESKVSAPYDEDFEWAKLQEFSSNLYKEERQREKEIKKSKQNIIKAELESQMEEKLSLIHI
eukprot:TRINITY_DN54759_c0_g1_i1.p1 TRINITY_DN54759_c0_g1~~TRINITY_DN54759_c0_g1_i1.p1  ORF type:complete len:118 (-),score=53.04 TRINITY_DN54759_c0_g1_i1:93-446(-)